MDNQVKVRGFRIELGEIKSVFNQYPLIINSVVVVREDQSGDQRLTAYVVLHDDCDMTVTEMRKYFRQKLPGYMLPQLFVELDHMPLTANGKIDRNALPDAMQEFSEMEGTVAPRTEQEKYIAGIWTELIKVKEISVNDCFFDIGGHSLLAMELIY